jgi:hypothetical protein
MPKTVKCRVIARNLFMKPDGKESNRLRECEVGEELSYKEGSMPPAWTGKVETIAAASKQKPDDDQSALIEKLTADLAEKDAMLAELTNPAEDKKLVQSNSGDK